MRKRLLLPIAVLVAVAAAAVLAAASAGRTSANAPSAKSPAAAPSGTVTLNGWQVSPAEETKLASVVKAFERTHPRIHVNYQSVTGDYQAQELAKFAARKPPDVLYVDVADIVDWTKQGVLQNLDSYVKKSHFSTKPYIKNLLNAFKYKGHIYGFPKDWSSLGMEVNTTLLGNNPVPKTWAQLKTVASKINVPGGKPICLSADWARLMAWVYQAGGNGQFKSANSAAFRTAVNYYVGLLKSGLAALPSDLGSSWCGEAFGKQKVAFAFEGNWMFPTMAGFPGVKFTTAPMPMGKKRGNLAFTVSYSMAKDSKNKPAAWELLKYLVGKTGMQQWVSLGLALPTRTDVHAVKGRGAFTKYPASVHGWGAQAGFRHIWNDVANNELTAVIQGKETVNAMLQKIAAAAR
jgi:multiple sugar transport system substrate-binding protein